MFLEGLIVSRNEFMETIIYLLHLLFSIPYFWVDVSYYIAVVDVGTVIIVVLRVMIR